MTDFSFSGNGLSAGTVRLYRTGAPQADVVLTDSGVVLTAGQRVVLTAGDISAPGTLRPGGEFGGTATWTVIGGAGRWDTRIPRRFYDDANGILLSHMVADLASDAGEFGAVLAIPDRSLGPRWERPEGPARDMLDFLSGGEWWVATDQIVNGATVNTTLTNGATVLGGWTVVGPRRPTTASLAGVTAATYDAALRRGAFATSDDSLWQLQAGATVALDGLPAPLLVGSAVLRFTSGHVEVELYGEATLPELLGNFVAAKTALARFHAAYPFTTTSATATAGPNAGMTGLMPANALSAAFPGPPNVPQWPGVPGLTATLQAGAGVAVIFLGGDPGSPTIVNYAPGVLAQSLAIDAVLGINLGTGSARFVREGDIYSVGTAVGPITFVAVGGTDPLPTKVKG